MYLVLYALSFPVQFINAQDTIQNVNNKYKIEELKKSKSDIQEEEKEFLKNEVEIINTRLENGEINEKEAQTLKEAAAKKRALNIENRVAIIDNKIALLERNEDGYKSDGSSKKTKIEIVIEDDDHDEGDIEEEDWISDQVFLVREAKCLIFRDK